MTLATVNGLARTGDAQQRLMLRAGQEAGGQLFNRLRLVAGGRVIGNEFKHALKLRPQHGSVKRNGTVATASHAKYAKL
jgi:hypothetical protein